MENLIQLIGEQVTPDILRKASAITGESEAAAQSGLNALLPTLVGAFAHKGANEHGAKKMMEWVNAQGDSEQFLNNYSGMLDNSESNGWLQDTGEALIAWLMGSKAEDSTSMISSASGIGSGSASTLMKAMAPLALAIIGKQALSNNMGAGGLASMFLGQKSFLQSAAPVGLTGLLGLSSFDDLGKATSKSYTTTTTTSSASSGVATPSVSASTVAAGTVAAGTVAAGTVAAGKVATDTVSVDTDVSGVSVPSFQSGNVAASGIETPALSVPDAKIATPAVSMPDAKVTAPVVSPAEMNLPDVDMPTATIDVDTIAPAKPLYNKVEADRRDFAFKSGRPDLPGGSAAGATVDPTSASFERSSASVDQSASLSPERAKVVTTEAGTDIIVEEKPLFNKVLRDKRDIPFGNFGGRWFGWALVTAAICAGLLFYTQQIPNFLGMFTGS